MPRYSTNAQANENGRGRRKSPRAAQHGKLLKQAPVSYEVVYLVATAAAKALTWAICLTKRNISTVQWNRTVELKTIETNSTSYHTANLQVVLLQALNFLAFARVTLNALVERRHGSIMRLNVAPHSEREGTRDILGVESSRKRFEALIDEHHEGVDERLFVSSSIRRIEECYE